MPTNALTHDPLLDVLRHDCLVTVGVPVPDASDDAGDQMEVHLRHLRTRLQGTVDDAAVDRLMTALGDLGHPQARAIVGVVTADDVMVWPSTRPLNDVEIAEGPLPHLGRLLAERQSWVPHVLVEVDRVGADLTIVDSRVDASADVSVDGAETHITKSNPGGWSQRRFQQRAEEHWEDNMRLVARTLVEQTEGTDIDLLLVTGGEQVIGMLTDDLPSRLTEHVIDLGAGGRAEDGSQDSTAAAADEAVREEASRRRATARRGVLDQIGQGRGVTGRTKVLEALMEGRVDTLMVHVDATEGLTAHVGEEPVHVAADASILHQLGLPARSVPLIDAALRGAAATGAAVVITLDAAEDIPDGLAASLRGA